MHPLLELFHIYKLPQEPVIDSWTSFIIPSLDLNLDSPYFIAAYYFLYYKISLDGKAKCGTYKKSQLRKAHKILKEHCENISIESVEYSCGLYSVHEKNYKILK